MNTVSSKDFYKQHQQNPMPIIDVREPDEFNAQFIPGSQNVPLGLIEQDSFKDIPKDQKVFLICQSGRRSQLACKLLKSQGYDQVFSVEGGIKACAKDSDLVVKKSRHLPIMRQVHLVAGFLIVLALLLSQWVHPYFILVSGLVGLGLVFSGLTGHCGMAMLLSKMPWNRQVFCAEPSSS